MSVGRGRLTTQESPSWWDMVLGPPPALGPSSPSPLRPKALHLSLSPVPGPHEKVGWGFLHVPGTAEVPGTEVGSDPGL